MTERINTTKYNNLVPITITQNSLNLGKLNNQPTNPKLLLKNPNHIIVESPVKLSFDLTPSNNITYTKIISAQNTIDALNQTFSNADFEPLDYTNKNSIPAVRTLERKNAIKKVYKDSETMTYNGVPKTNKTNTTFIPTGIVPGVKNFYREPNSPKSEASDLTKVNEEPGEELEDFLSNIESYKKRPVKKGKTGAPKSNQNYELGINK